jgi:hypothetical protein
MWCTWCIGHDLFQPPGSSQEKQIFTSIQGSSLWTKDRPIANSQPTENKSQREREGRQKSKSFSFADNGLFHVQIKACAYLIAVAAVAISSSP